MGTKAIRPLVENARNQGTLIPVSFQILLSKSHGACGLLGMVWRARLRSRANIVHLDRLFFESLVLRAQPRQPEGLRNRGLALGDRGNKIGTAQPVSLSQIRG